MTGWGMHQGEAHVWIVPLDAAPALAGRARGCLSAPERERAERFTDPLMRDRFITMRVALRTLLADCTGLSPARLDLHRTEQGKPFIAARAGLDFSISHSREVGVIALAATAIGVDVEHVRRPLYLDRTARRILHEDTVRLLETMAPDRRVAAFIDAWTLREAHVKAVGGGLFRTPDTIPFDPGQPADCSLREVQGRDGRSWSVARIAPGEQTRAAVVLQGAPSALHVHNERMTADRMREAFDE